MEQTLALIERSHKGDKDARNVLAQQNMGLVYTVARRFNGRGCEMEDLIQIGSIGLLKAIDKFDLSYDVRFSTYAVPMIAGEIKRFLRDDGMIKVSRSLKEMAVKVCMTREKLEKDYGREPTLEEVSGLEINNIGEYDFLVTYEAKKTAGACAQLRKNHICRGTVVFWGGFYDHDV